jgi:tripartite-type tricarboxylate transporter receptor subunit TctC
MTKRNESNRDLTGRRGTSSSHVCCIGTGVFRIGFAVALIAMMFVALRPALAQTNYPNKQIRVIVAFAPGGIADVIGRLVSQKLGEQFGQTIVVENRPGAGGTLGAKVVSNAPADGYTLLVTTSALAINAVAMKNAVDPRTQLTPVAVVATAPMIFVANKDVPTDNLMKYLREEKKGHFTYSTAGVGAAEHLTAAYIFQVTPGFTAIHVPFSGGVEAINAALGKHVDLSSATVPSALSLINSGDLHVLAVASHKRLVMLPNIPTLKEAGFPDLDNASWIAVFAPPGMPSAIAEKLNAGINKALADPDVSRKLASLGFLLRPESQKEFSETLKADVAKWDDIVKAIGFKPN